MSCPGTSFMVVISMHFTFDTRRHDPVQNVEQLRDRSDPRPVPLSELGPRRILAGAVNEDRLHADALRAGELVVRAVAHEDGLLRLDAEQLAAVEVDARVRLGEADSRREDLCVEEPLELRLRPERLDVLAADGNQPNE